MGHQTWNQPSMRVLFVDDEPNILNALKRLFRGPQRTILTATSAAAGLDLLAEHRVDVGGGRSVIVLDAPSAREHAPFIFEGKP